jgi:PAS domain S-box-containing protein
VRTFFSQTTGIGLLLFIVLSIYNIVLDIQEDIHYIKKIEIIKKQVNQIEKNSEIVLELQRERGLTSIYMVSLSKEHEKIMLEQREKSTLAMSKNPQLFKDSVYNIRNMLGSENVTREYIFALYSELIRSLLLDTKSLTFHTSDKELKNELLVYNDLSALQEILGQLRAKIGIVLSAKDISAFQQEDIDRTNTLFYHQLEITFVNDILSSYDYTKQISKTKCLKHTLRISKSISNEFLKKNDTLSAIEWFNISSCAIDRINSYVNNQIDTIKQNIEMSIGEAKDKRMKHFIVWLFGFIILAIFVYISFKKSKDLLKEQAMLRNYKRAIDYSSMVLTSNTKGLITHVNPRLCEKSGFTEEELLGQKFSVLFDDDVYRKIIREMYQNVKEKKNYNSVIKYSAKDGKTFWVDTFVIPILDDKNNLVEYISIGYDISEVLHLNNEIQDTQRELLYRLAEAVESRNKESGNHIKRVAHYSRALAELFKLSSSECDIIFAASSMHDVGKIAIPDKILLKPGKLTQEEWLIMKTHSEIGYKLFKDSKREILRAAADISYQHHEFYNGKGYPRGLKGEEISIFGRVVAIADVFDALYSKRPYKEPWKLEDILELLEREAGEQFDPNLIKLFIDNIDVFLKIWQKYE